MENKEKGSFVGSVLLSSPVWDAEKLKKDLLDEWNISVPDEEETDNDTIVFEAAGTRACGRGGVLRQVQLFLERRCGRGQ